jgi:kumamolisin
MASSGFVTLHGSERKPLAHSRAAGPVDPAEPTSVTVRLRPVNDIAALAATVEKLYARPLAKRTYLTRDELTHRHGARREDLDSIEHFAQRHNLTVSHRSAGQRSLTLTGPLGDILSAFPAKLRMFEHSSGRYRGRSGGISIPRAFRGIITGVFGLDTRPNVKASFRPRSSPATALVPATVFAKRYNFPPFDGSGQCIGIIELGGGFTNSDLHAYFRDIGIQTPNVAAISVDHGGARKPQFADGEVMLDIEVAGAVAPHANIAVYFAPHRGAGFLDAVNAAVHDAERSPGVISISWSSPEDPAAQQTITAFHEVFLEAAALGITICASAGDHGTAGMDAADWDRKIHVAHPSTDDLVLACGGTQIDERGNDVVWNDGTPLSAGGWASGGGISQTRRVPAYQKGVKFPTPLAGKRGRGVPDIAMSATGYLSRVHGAPGPQGGTSAVAPLMAGLVALLNQARKKNVGWLNPFLYANADTGIVKYVTEGTNAIAKTVKGYRAQAGWNACAGLGTPDGARILQRL